MQVEPGEIGATAADVSVWDRTGFLRAGVDWTVDDDHRLRFATAPTYHDRTGDDRLAEVNDPATAHRTMLKWVNGLEYETHFFAGKIVNAAFGKHYLQKSRSEESFADVTTDRYSDRLLWGFGDGLRYDLLDWLFAKASYEFATRLPEPKELFGNGGFVLENLGLEPERSHNVNVTLAVDDLATPSGKLSGNVTGFFRKADNLIVLFPVGETLRYENVYEARVGGVEGALSWLSPGEYVELGGNATYQSLRNESDAGPLALFNGERIPNKPYFWANGRVRLQRREFAAAGDELSLTWYTRYMRSFYRNWEGAGRKGPEDSVPEQLTHGAVLAYVTSSQRAGQLAVTGEVHNITDERVFDFLGVQRPGRASYLKVTLSH
jgi:outer membrane cobalamin receptor